MSKRKPISQREAMRMRKRIKELENHIHRFQATSWDKKEVCSFTIEPYLSDRISMAEEFGNILTIRRKHLSTPHAFVVCSTPRIQLP